MARKTQQEINYWFQDNTVKSALDLSLIEKVLRNNNLDIPNNIIINKNGNTYDDFARWYCDETKISKYPTSYEECCKITEDVADASLTCFACKLLNDFQKLLLCRDAYWKIAGEELGLDGHWEPDWKNSEERRYCIVNIEGEINLPEKILTKWILKVTNKILVFPTEEMRDAFYENFKYLIEACKTLL